MNGLRVLGVMLVGVLPSSAGSTAVPAPTFRYVLVIAPAAGMPANMRLTPDRIIAAGNLGQLGAELKPATEQAAVTACRVPRVRACDIVRLVVAPAKEFEPPSTQLYANVKLNLDGVDGHELDIPDPIVICNDSPYPDTRKSCLDRAAKDVADALTAHYIDPQWGHKKP